MNASGMSGARVTAVVAALWLAACGGGGDNGTASTGPDAVAGTPGAATSPAPLTAAALTFAAVPGLAANPYQWVATDETGRMMAATTVTAGGGGQIFLSTDHGASFKASSAPIAQWVGLDMTPDGTRMVAVASGGGLFRSMDSGVTWMPIDIGVNPLGSLPYESITISDDGTHVVAATLNGAILFSTDAESDAPTFTVATLSGGGALTDAFRAVDSSASGATVVAASSNGRLYVSSDGGATFSLLPVTVGSTTVADGWFRVAISGDGTRIAVAGSTDFGQGVDPAPRSTGLYVGNLANGRWTWTQGSTVTGAYTSVSMSSDGNVIGATLSSTTGGTAGEVLLSSDGGKTFTRVATPGNETNWRAMALSDDASRAVLAAGTPQQTDGLLYVSPEAGGSSPTLAPPAPTPAPTAAPVTTPAVPVLSPISPALAPLAPAAPALSPLAPTLSPAAVPTPAPAFTPVAPAFSPLAPALAPLSPAAPALTPVAPVPAPTLAPVAPVAPAISPALGPVTVSPSGVIDPFAPTM